jgi:guanylate kinase
MIIISGPSTIGKNPLIEIICKNYKAEFITPVTTRLKRDEENNTVDYYFISKLKFLNQIKSDSFIEWDFNLSNLYGFYFFNNPQNKITHSLSRMAIRIKRKTENAITIFLYPKNIEHIKSTLKKIYSGKDLQLRLYHLDEELYLSSLFDYVFYVDEGVDLIDNNEFQTLIKNHFR